MKSLDIETQSPRKLRNPYGPGGGAAAAHSTAKTYFLFCLALFVIYGVGRMMVPSDSADNEWASKGDAAGGWNTHPIDGSATLGSGGSYAAAAGTNGWNAPMPGEDSYDDPDDEWAGPEGYSSGGGRGWGDETKSTWDIPASSPNAAASSHSNADLEIREADLLMILSPLLFVPSHSRPEYERYQKESGIESESGLEELLYDMATPHGMAFDFMLNRDKRPIGHDDNHVTQRFVLTLLFYATGGKDEGAAASSANEGARTSGWDSGTAHFLTGLHECHWVKKSLEDQFWGILSMEGDSDRRVGVTKCNVDMEVTEIRLADLNLVGFIPEEIKWLSSLESFDIQNNHLAGPIPRSMGELEELRYLSLDGNNFSGTIPDVFDSLFHLERAYLNFNDFNGAMPPSFCTLREEGTLTDLWSDCGGYPITCTCCTVCCDMVAECNEMDSQKGSA